MPMLNGTALYRQWLTYLQVVGLALQPEILSNVLLHYIQYNEMQSTSHRLLRTSSWLFTLVVLRVACDVTTVEDS